MLPDEAKTKEQLINELAALRQQVAEVETLEETERKQAEEALRLQSEIVANMVEGVLLTRTSDRMMVYTNPRFEEMFGYGPGELIGKNVSVLNAPGEQTPEEVAEEIIKQLNENGVWYGEVHNIRKDGTRFWCRANISTFEYPMYGKVDVNVLEDITERKRVEEALRDSEQNFRNSLDSSPLGITVGSADETLIYANQAFLDVYGYSSVEELKAVPRKERYTPESYAKLEGRRERRKLGKPVPANFEISIVRKDGKVRHLAVFHKEVIWGGETRFQALCQDITERKQAEEALRESEERYRALMNLGGSVGEAIVMLQDKDGVDAVQTFVSNEWPRITGYSRKELLGMSFFDLLHSRHREASLKRHKRRMSGEIIPGLFEMSIIRKDGTEVPIEITSAYTTYQGERVNVAFIRDITERKQAEEREKELQRELNLSSRLASIGQLAAGVAHEINNPLTGILAFSEHLLRKNTDQKSSRDLRIIYDEALRAARVVENLRAFARRSEPEKEYSDINEILGRALELRTYELRTNNIELAVELAPDIPKAMVDFKQVQQVFLNIVFNAEQAMTEANNGGKLTIKTQPTKGYIRISFTDDGPGIPAEHLDRVFDPFFTTRGERGGTGLGLSVCHGIVTEHGGKIYARSKPGKGAAFFVELPFSPIDASFGDRY